MALSADQIIERIANANHVEPAVMRRQMEQAILNILADTTQPHFLMLAELFPGGIPTTEEFVVAMEQDLYEAMIPKFPGWEWDGVGYRNIR